MSDGQPPPGMSAADQFNMNSARSASEGGGEGGGGVFGVLGRYLGINLEQPQSMLEILSIDYWSKQFPGIANTFSVAKSWAGAWWDDLMQRLSIQSGVYDNTGFEQVQGPPVEAASGGGGMDIGGDGGGGPAIGAPMMESMDISSGPITPPDIPNMGTGRSANVDMG